MKKTIGMIIAAALMVLVFAGCSKGTAASADLPKVMAEMQQQVKFTDTIAISKDDLKANYGIEAADVKQFAGIADTTGTKADEIVMIEGKDADAAKRIKGALDTRYQTKINENITYLPAQYAIIKKCSVRQTGNYVSMIVSPEADKLVKIYDENVK